MKFESKYLILQILFCVIFPCTLIAEVKLPDIFCDHMILQREMPIPVWGTADVNEKISVHFNSSVTTELSDFNGKWKLMLPEMEAGGPFEMVITSNQETLRIIDIYVGEVWICSGQSNMEWPLQQSKEGEQEILKANFPLIRFFHLKKKHDTYNSAYSQEELNSFSEGHFFEQPKWELCSPKTGAAFSGVGYFFGKKLHLSLDVPVGLIQAAVGGSPAQSWISKAALASHPQLEHLVDENKFWTDSKIIHPWLAGRARENWADWEQDENSPLPGHPFAPTFLYKSAIQPLAPFGMRGVIWYQGESNATHPISYPAMMEKLVESWRTIWGQGDFPFYFVQLPKIGNRSLWPEFREAQQESLTILNTGMVVSIDQGHPTDVHPKEKKVIGQRLAGLALSKTYQKEILAESPMLETHNWDKKERTLSLQFQNTYEGLKIKNNEIPKGFYFQGYISQGGEEVIIGPKEVIISNQKITLTYPEDFLPTKVKYAWAPFPENNVINSAHLPMAPFKIELEGSN